MSSSRMASFAAALTLALVLAAGCSASTPTTAPRRTGGSSTATPGFIALPARSARSAMTPHETRKTTSSEAPTARPPRGGSTLPGSLFSVAAAVGQEEAAPLVAERDARRMATKSALLGVFGEEVDNDHAGGGSARTDVDPILACPSSLGELTDGVRSYGGVGPGSLYFSYKSSDKMPDVKYQVGPDFVDFAEPAKPAWRLTRGETVKERTFQTPLVSWLYERGWRQSFNANGFPGIEEEFQLVSEFFSSTGADGEAVIDLSCGSGLMMRKLVASGRYSRVIGGDLSPTMLAETARRFKEEDLGVPELIRCDVSRLPLKTESLDGVHAGAALHCWSKLEDSLSEVYRVLKPGRGFFATTFLKCVCVCFYPSATVSRAQRGDGFAFFEIDELERLMQNAGFADVEVVQEGTACAIVRAIKEA
ncbi:unnamed protein product [Pylaiella littoralis]